MKILQNNNMFKKTGWSIWYILRKYFSLQFPLSGSLSHGINDNIVVQLDNYLLNWIGLIHFFIQNTSNCEVLVGVFKLNILIFCSLL